MQENFLHKKVTIIGTGMVGMSYAYALTIKGFVRELGLINRTPERAQGEAMDLCHCLPFVEPMDIKAGGYEMCRDAQIVVITAGAAQREGETRLDLLHKNAGIIQDIVPRVLEQNPNPILLIASNPVDVLTYVALKVSGLPSSRVIGSGTVLDTMRFRYLISQYYNVDARNVHGYILGEHGDSEVPVWSRVNIAGIPLSEYCMMCGELVDSQKKEIESDVRNAAYHVIQKKDSTYYAIGLALVRITQAILMNQQSVLTVGTLVNGEYGIKDVCLSLPCVVGSNGISQVLANPMQQKEVEALQNSAAVLRKALDSIGW